MNKKIFWSFQSAYWSVYFLYNIFVVHYNSFVKAETPPIIIISYLLLLCFFGIPLSIVSTKILSNPKVNQLSLVSILFAIIFISFLLANIWVLEILTLDKIYNEILQLYSFTRHRLILFKWRVYLWESFFATLLLFAWNAIYLFLKFWDEWHKQRFEIEKANLELELAQLKMLRSQISPHFLFNALSSLRALIRKEPPRAEQMLSKISEFLRYSLVHKSSVEVPFSEELVAAENYFDIEKVRFGDKLQVEFAIDPAAEEFPVPAFILHPIIDNSVKYGMESTKLPLRISVSALIISNRLRIEVLNSGIWKERDVGNGGTGTGLQNVESRLQTHYPGRYQLQFEKADESVKIVLELEHSLGTDNG